MMKSIVHRLSPSQEGAESTTAQTTAGAQEQHQESPTTGTVISDTQPVAAPPSTAAANTATSGDEGSDCSSSSSSSTISFAPSSLLSFEHVVLGRIAVVMPHVVPTDNDNSKNKTKPLATHFLRATPLPFRSSLTIWEEKQENTKELPTTNANDETTTKLSSSSTTKVQPDGISSNGKDASHKGKEPSHPQTQPLSSNGNPILIVPQPDEQHAVKSESPPEPLIAAKAVADVPSSPKLSKAVIPDKSALHRKSSPIPDKTKSMGGESSKLSATPKKKLSLLSGKRRSVGKKTQISKQSTTTRQPGVDYRIASPGTPTIIGQNEDSLRSPSSTLSKKEKKKKKSSKKKRKRESTPASPDHRKRLVIDFSQFDDAEYEPSRSLVGTGTRGKASRPGPPVPPVWRIDRDSSPRGRAETATTMDTSSQFDDAPEDLDATVPLPTSTSGRPTAAERRERLLHAQQTAHDVSKAYESAELRLNRHAYQRENATRIPPGYSDDYDAEVPYAGVGRGYDATASVCEQDGLIAARLDALAFRERENAFAIQQHHAAASAVASMAYAVPGYVPPPTSVSRPGGMSAVEVQARLNLAREVSISTGAVGMSSPATAEAQSRMDLTRDASFLRSLSERYPPGQPRRMVEIIDLASETKEEDDRLSS